MFRTHLLRLAQSEQPTEEAAPQPRSSGASDALAPIESCIRSNADPSTARRRCSRRREAGARPAAATVGRRAALAAAALVLPRKTHAEEAKNEVVPGTDEFLAAAGLKKKTVLNADGEYFDEAKEAGSWQDAWAQRAAKASKMSGDDILNAARGAGNVDASQPESAKARKRRAVAACRTDAVRERMAAGTAAECLERALAGETDFVLGKS